MGSRDLISDLPDEILGKILSLLWTNRAACTSILSKRWRNLLALVDNLHLDDAIGDPRYFCDFVDRTLALLSNSTTVKRVSLTINEFKYDGSQVNTWIRTVLERGCLQLYLETGFLYFIDTQFFTSNTLVELTISHEFCLQGLLPPGGVFFPKLKTLSLHGAYVDSNIYELFIAGCPVLEELFLHYDDYGRPPPLRNVIVSSLSVKRLTIFHYFPDYPSGHLDCRIQTPSLVYLDYSSYAADQYEVDLASLVEARLNLLSWERLNDWGDGEDDSVYSHPDYGFSDVTNLVAGISNIKTLHLSPDSLEVFYFRCNSMPVFHNLLTLSFESDKDRGWQVVPLLINSSPNLETLVIKGLVHQVTRRCGNACVCVPKKQKKKKNKKRTEERVCCLSTCQVKVLNISAYGGTCRELKQMRHFLGNLKFLETVNVGVEVNHGEDNDVNNEYLRITDDLMQLPRVSSNCRIHFF